MKFTFKMIKNTLIGTFMFLMMVCIMSAIFGLILHFTGAAVVSTAAAVVTTVGAAIVATGITWMWKDTLEKHVVNMLVSASAPTNDFKELGFGFIFGLVAFALISLQVSYVLIAMGFAMSTVSLVNFAVSTLLYFINMGYLSIVVKHFSRI